MLLGFGAAAVRLPIPERRAPAGRRRGHEPAAGRRMGAGLRRASASGARTGRRSARGRSRARSGGGDTLRLVCPAALSRRVDAPLIASLTCRRSGRASRRGGVQHAHRGWGRATTRGPHERRGQVKRRIAVRAALAATGALALAAGTAGAHPMRLRRPRATAGSTPALGGALELATAPRAPWPAASHGTARARTGLELVGQFDLGGKLGGARPRGRRLGQGQLRLPDDVLRADLRPRRRADRRHRRPGEPEGRRATSRATSDTFSGEGSQVVTLEHAVLQGRPARLPERVVPGHDQRRGRHHARRRYATRARRRSSSRAPATSPRRTAAQTNGVPQTQGQPDALGLRLGATTRRPGEGLRRARRRHGGARTSTSSTSPTRPSRSSSPRRTSTSSPRPARTRPHGDSVFSHDMIVKRIGGPRHHADVLLGRRLRHARRDQPGERRSRCRTPTSRRSTRRARRSGRRSRPRATPTRPSSRVTTSSSSPRTRTSTRTACRPRSRAARRTARRSRRIQGGRHQAGQQGQSAGRGDTRFLGLGCDPVAAAGRTGQIAVVERGVVRLPGQARQRRGGGLQGPDRVQPHAAPTAARRWSTCSPPRRRPRRSSCRARTASGCSASSRRAGLHVRADATADGTATPARPVGARWTSSAVFDGWGYTHMYETDLTEGAKMQEVDIYAPPEGQLEAFAENFGDMTVHEVATDPGREPGLRLALRARHARARATTTPASRRSARSSSRAAPTTGASRSTRSDGKTVHPRDPTAIAACGSSRSAAESLQDQRTRRGAGIRRPLSRSRTLTGAGPPRSRGLLGERAAVLARVAPGRADAAGRMRMTCAPPVGIAYGGPTRRRGPTRAGARPRARASGPRRAGRRRRGSGADGRPPAAASSRSRAGWRAPARGPAAA